MKSVFVTYRNGDLPPPCPVEGAEVLAHDDWHYDEGLRKRRYLYYQRQPEQANRSKE